MFRKEKLVSAAMECLGSLYVLLAVSLCVTVGFLPLVLLMMVSGDTAVPLTLAVSWLCSPAIGAAFAVFRDHPAVARWRSETAECRDVPDWMAAPYVRDDAGSAVFMPFVHAWRRLCRRMWAVTAVFAMLWLAVALRLGMGAEVLLGALTMPTTVVVLVLSVPAYAMAVNLMVEYPRAKIRAVLRNATVLCVRRFGLAIPTLAVLAAYAMGAMVQPMLVVPLCTGLVLFVCRADAHWQCRPLAEALARE